jgi:hypothetical protein
LIPNLSNELTSSFRIAGVFSAFIVVRTDNRIIDTTHLIITAISETFVILVTRIAYIGIYTTLFRITVGRLTSIVIIATNIRNVNTSGDRMTEVSSTSIFIITIYWFMFTR